MKNLPKLGPPYVGRFYTSQQETDFAIRAVRAAVEGGILPPVREMKCMDCDAPAVNYDHRWYSRPLKVDPVCSRCNNLRGPAYDQEIRSAVTGRRVKRSTWMKHRGARISIDHTLWWKREQANAQIADLVARQVSQ